MTTAQTEKKIRAAFTVLRNKGYFAVANLACCHSCAIDLVPDDADKWAYGTDNDLMNLDDGHSFSIGWGGDASEIVDALKAQGLDASHDGDHEVRIFVK